MSDDPHVNDVVDMGLEETEEQRYIVLFDQDYDDLLLDTHDSVAIRVDLNQACEVLRLASTTVAELAGEDAPDEEPIDRMIEELQELTDNE